MKFLSLTIVIEMNHSICDMDDHISCDYNATFDVTFVLFLYMH
jgi:hypothetical protein